LKSLSEILSWCLFSSVNKMDGPANPWGGWSLTCRYDVAILHFSSTIDNGEFISPMGFVIKPMNT
jgi:hypothetical protein